MGRNRHTTAAVDTASGKLTFLYALKDGAADQSYGAHVAELAGFPAHVLEASRRRAVEFEHVTKPGKRARHAGNDATVAHIRAADNEDEFVRRALEGLGQHTLLGSNGA